MKIVRAGEGQAQDVSGAAIFSGGQVLRRAFAGRDVGGGKDFSVSLIHFAAGARNALHRHSSDQVLFVVEGEGQVGTRGVSHRISAGDAVVIPAGEDHWHGAGATGSPMAHLAITRADSVTTVSL